MRGGAGGDGRKYSLRMKRLLVIGGGLAGLNAAYQAKRAGAEVRVLEATDHAGGVVQSERQDGFLTETGPNTLLSANPEFQKLIAELGLEKEIVDSAPTARERFKALQEFISTYLLDAQVKLLSARIGLRPQMRIRFRPVMGQVETDEATIPEGQP